MAVTSGFFNSIGHDRKYNAEQFSSIFDGVINDGVYGTVGNGFAVTPAGGLKVYVDTGRAWFNHAWVLNDGVITLTHDVPTAGLDRIDAVVITVDRSTSGRTGRIEIVKGVESRTPSRPSMSQGSEVFQYPIAYVRVNHTMTIGAGDITYNVGQANCPIVTGVCEDKKLVNTVNKNTANISTLTDKIGTLSTVVVSDRVTGTIGASGYTSLGKFASGKTINDVLSVYVYGFNTISGAISLALGATGVFATGAPNTTYNGLMYAVVYK